MKASLLSKELRDYVIEANIEREGETYRVVINYDIYDGYEVTFTDYLGKRIDMPEWAKQMQEDSDDHLGYQLEELVQEGDN